MHIDSKVFVKGIRSGPHWKHQSHAVEWAGLWWTLGSRSITAIKIKAHTTVGAVIEAGGSASAWTANQQADEQAEEAAKAAQLYRG